MSTRLAGGRTRTTASDRRRLIGVLADGRFHSGQDIASQLGVSRSAVWKHLGWLRAQGVDVEAIPRRGYRLERAVRLLDRDRILDALTVDARGRLESLEVLLEVDSTNRVAGALPAPPPGRARGCLAEIQSAGKGRRGRSWLAPFGSGLCLSIAWVFTELPGSFPALGLAVGVAVTRALSRIGAGAIALKWPNDLVWHRRKLGGILVEVRGQAETGTHVVIGLGLNVRMPPATRLELAEHHGVAVADLHEAVRGELPDRNDVAAILLDAVPAALEEFETSGFAPFLAEWQVRDACRDLPVKLIAGAGAGMIRGIARGVASDGALLLDRGGRIERYVSGELSLRLEGA